MIDAMLFVSVIIPCYNEEKTISSLLHSLINQTYPIQDFEVVIIDGMSTDNTRKIIQEFVYENSSLLVRVEDNLDRKIPTALNIGIKAANGEIIVRLDAHSIPNKKYIEYCVQDLTAGRGSNVGGVWDIKPSAETWEGRSIAIAAAHPFGVGDAQYRFTEKSQYVDTVPFGSYFKKTLIDLGGFDEKMVANEDYDLNARILANGGKIWLNANITAAYFARSTFQKLAQQYWRYGYWKVKMLRKFPTTIRFRQAIPPLFVLSLLVGPLLYSYLPFLRLPYQMGVVLYGLALFSAGIQSSFENKSIEFLLGVPVAIVIMHLFWGGAFLWSLFDEVLKGNRNN